MVSGPLLVGYDGSEGSEGGARGCGSRGSSPRTRRSWPATGSRSPRRRSGSRLDIRELVQDPSDINRREVALAAELADEGAWLAQAAGLDAEGRAVEIDGPIAEAILSYADELDATAVVLGSRSRSSIRSLLLGSIATQVVQRATRPVSSRPHRTSQADAAINSREKARKSKPGSTDRGRWGGVRRRRRPWGRCSDW